MMKDRHNGDESIDRPIKAQVLKTDEISHRKSIMLNF